MTINVQRATEIARAEIQRQYGNRISVSLLAGAPRPLYMFGAVDPQGWLFFAADDPKVFRVGGSECLAVHAETGEVRYLGVVGE